MKETKRKVKFITLGCRVNQYETQGMKDALGREGFESFSGSLPVPRVLNPAEEKTVCEGASGHADFVVINTCTVTGEADRESRYWIRRARREHPGARIVVTGCGVEHDHPVLSKMPEVDQLVFNHEKSDIGKHLAEVCGGLTDETDAGQRRKERSRRFLPLSIASSEGRTRAFVKIQDGCNHACSFCKVVLVRGSSRSRPVEEIVPEIERLCDHGYQDIVLTGIQLGAYGRDGSKKRESGLPHLLEKCARIAGVRRLRLSSIEPTDITPELIGAIRDISKCMPHLHIPLQSGDNEILRRMNRRYDSGFYEGLINRLRSEIPDFNLTLDVMAGFPGEGPAHFENTLRLLERIEPLKCHVFPYSPRKGTRAAGFAGAVPPPVLRDRVRRLIALEQKLGDVVMSRYVGREFEVLVEGGKNRDKDQAMPGVRETGRGRMLYGHTPHFMKVGFWGEEAWVGRIIRVKLSGVRDHFLTGLAAP